MTNQIDSYKFTSGITKRVIKSWMALNEPHDIPWTPLDKPLSQCRVSLISSAGIALKDDQPFDQEGERQNPWWGDTSYRVIPRETTTEDIEIYHLHIDPQFGKQDINVLLPLQRLADLEQAGEIGTVADRHYSFMGYTPQPKKLVEESAPSMIRSLREDEVDLVILVPA